MACVSHFVSYVGVDTRNSANPCMSVMGVGTAREGACVCPDIVRLNERFLGEAVKSMRLHSIVCQLSHRSTQRPPSWFEDLWRRFVHEYCSPMLTVMRKRVNAVRHAEPRRNVWILRRHNMHSFVHNPSTKMHANLLFSFIHSFLCRNIVLLLFLATILSPCSLPRPSILRDEHMA